MKRIITLLLAVAMLAGVIMLSVACTKDPGVTTTDSGKSTEGTTTKGNAAGTTTTGGAAGTDGTTSSSGATTTNPSGTTTTGGEEPVVEWDGKTKLPGKEDVDFGGRTFLLASIDDGQGYDATDEIWVESLTTSTVLKKVHVVG